LVAEHEPWLAQVRVICVPRSDAPFATAVQIALQALPVGATAEELQEVVRRLYPRAIVRPPGHLGSLAGAGTVRYAYRDVDAADDSDDAWALDPGAATASLAPDGRYREANGAYLELLGLEREADLVGRAWSDVVPSEALADAARLRARLADAGISVQDAGIHSTFTLARGDGTPVEVEYLTRWDPAAGLFRTRIRPVRVAVGAAMAGESAAES
jgi:PAS domain-containing protein